MESRFIRPKVVNFFIDIETREGESLYKKVLSHDLSWSRGLELFHIFLDFGLIESEKTGRSHNKIKFTEKGKELRIALINFKLCFLVLINFKSCFLV